MSQRPIALSPDLKRLRDEGYDIRCEKGYLLVRDIPYLASKDQIRRGILVCTLGDLADDIAQAPPDHTAHFVGAEPHNADGTPMTQIINSANAVKITDEITTNFYLSAKPKPAGRYANFYEKVVTYARRLSGPAQDLDITASAITHPFVPEEDGDSVFNYTDTASSRADIVAVTNKLILNRVAILGLGGTGSYILDALAKTPVREIHLFDGDLFLQHNAFRAPGAASGDELKAKPYKVDHFAGIYSKMRKGIVPHREYITEANLEKLEGMDFVFMSMEAGPVKKKVVENLLSLAIPFVDVGMGVYLRNDHLGGTLRTTTGTQRKSDHIWENLPLTDGGLKNEYDKNIQIADLNMLHAALAVIKWKKLFGFYADQRDEHYSTYAITRNETNNEELG
jgi:hypothetical protein